MDSDNAIRNIIKEIHRDCRSHRITVHDNFITYFAKLMILNPNWNVSTDFMSTRNDVQVFVKHVVESLKDLRKPRIITLRMQFYFSCNFDNRFDLILKNRRDLVKRIDPLKQEILDTDSVPNPNDMDKLYRKIITYVTLVSGLGNPTVEAVFNEAKAAIHSILSETELADFCQFHKEQKELELNDMVKITAGIRLYNRDANKGGQGIEDLPTMVSYAADQLKTDLEFKLSYFEDELKEVQNAIEVCYEIDMDEEHNYVLNFCLPTGVSPADIDHFKEVILTYRQYEIYLKKIILEIDQIEHNLDVSTKKFEHLLANLHTIIQNRIAIPVNGVFPSFRKLCEAWMEIQDEAIFLSKLNQIVYNIGLYKKEVRVNSAIIQLLVQETDNLEERSIDLEFQHIRQTTKFNEERNGSISSVSTIPIVYTLAEFKNKHKLNFAFGGYCLYMFVEADGVLLPGNPRYGIVRYGGKNYIFSSPSAGELFQDCPLGYIRQLLSMARVRVEYINFFGMKDLLLEHMDTQTLIIPAPIKKKVDSVGVQTELHAELVHLDFTYRHNLWGFKRKGLKLADLAIMKTTATNTVSSCNRKDVRLQTITTTDCTSQTKTDNYSNTVNPKMYLWGLRGRKDEKTHIVDLTHSIKE